MGWFSKITHAVGDVFDSTVGAVVTGAVDAVNDVSHAVGDAAETVVDSVGDSWSFIGDVLGTMVTGVKAIFGGIDTPKPIEVSDVSDELGGKARANQADAPDNAPGGGRQGDVGGGTLLTGGEEEEKKNPMKKTLLGE